MHLVVLLGMVDPSFHVLNFIDVHSKAYRTHFQKPICQYFVFYTTVFLSTLAVAKMTYILVFR